MTSSALSIKTCKNCRQKFSFTVEDKNLLDSMRVTINGKQYAINEPTFCPDCRQQRRLTFNNEMKLYHRKCDFSGEQMVSTYSPDKSYKVYANTVWWSDKWDPFIYGKSFDFNRPFFDQFDELLQNVPHPALWNNFLLDENSRYTNYGGNNKNCYLIFHADKNSDCYYGYG